MSQRVRAQILAYALACASIVLSACDGPPPPQISELPDFELVTHSGGTFQRSDLLGKVTVVSFVFTRCPTICPMLSANAAELQDKYEGEENFRLLSISVDPERDTPEVLREYRSQIGAKDAVWTHLTGDSADVNRTVVRGFRAAMGEPDHEVEDYDIMHSSHFVLVDENAFILGYYRTDEEGLEQLDENLETLLDL